MSGLSEALALGASMGLDPAKLTAVINTSSARCWASEVYNPVPVREAAASGGVCVFLMVVTVVAVVVFSSGCMYTCISSDRLRRSHTMPVDVGRERCAAV